MVRNPSPPRHPSEPSHPYPLAHPLAAHESPYPFAHPVALAETTPTTAALAADTAPPFLSIEQKLARLNAQGSLISEQQRRITAMQNISLQHIQHQAAGAAGASATVGGVSTGGLGATISFGHMPSASLVAASSATLAAAGVSSAGPLPATSPQAPHPTIGAGLVGLGGATPAQMRAAAAAAASRQFDQPGMSVSNVFARLLFLFVEALWFVLLQIHHALNSFELSNSASWMNLWLSNSRRGPTNNTLSTLSSPSSPTSPHPPLPHRRCCRSARNLK